ncbi:hypothetical protein TNCV_3880721 [Trichonephila clavipes]|nr:hypothetical protein TNCV_3880721 [Trichonephila clavipes]
MQRNFERSIFGLADDVDTEQGLPHDLLRFDYHTASTFHCQSQSGAKKNLSFSDVRRLSASTHTAPNGLPSESFLTLSDVSKLLTHLVLVMIFQIQLASYMGLD